MQYEVNDMLAERFKAALEKSGENEKAVIERMFKTYIHEVFSRNIETSYALGAFRSL